jgi:hypothetical protein
MRRSVIAEVGLFDEHLGPGTPFPGAQDNDFGFRLLEAGYRIVYEPSAVAYHRAWRARGDYLPLSWSYGRGQGAFYGKYLSFRDRYMLGRMWKDVRRHVLLFVREVLRHPHTAAGHLVYVGGVVSGTAGWRLSQKTQQGERYSFGGC